MGIKNLKERFQIKHIVQKTSGYIAIGSPYVHNLITIKPDMSIHWSSLGASSNDDLSRYFKEMSEAAESGELAKIINSPDKFGKTIPVWTFKNGRIIKKQCEVFGWPNTSTDGKIMDSYFYKSRKEALRGCKIGVLSTIKIMYSTLPDVFYQNKRFFKHTLLGIKAFIRAFMFFGI